MDTYRKELVDYGHIHEIGRGGDKGKGVMINDDVIPVIEKIRPPSDAVVFELEEMTEFVCSLNWGELLLLVYTMDRDYAENSLKLAETDANRMPIARRVVRSDKISISKGAELAGMELRRFREILAANGDNR